jgi:hypothetical protein
MQTGNGDDHDEKYNEEATSLSGVMWSDDRCLDSGSYQSCGGITSGVNPSRSGWESEDENVRRERIVERLSRFYSYVLDHSGLSKNAYP